MESSTQAETVLLFGSCQLQHIQKWVGWADLVTWREHRRPLSSPLSLSTIQQLLC